MRASCYWVIRVKLTQLRKRKFESLVLLIVVVFSGFTIKISRTWVTDIQFKIKLWVINWVNVEILLRINYKYWRKFLSQFTNEKFKFRTIRSRFSTFKKLILNHKWKKY